MAAPTALRLASEINVRKVDCYDETIHSYLGVIDDLREIYGYLATISTTTTNTTISIYVIDEKDIEKELLYDLKSGRKHMSIFSLTPIISFNPL